MESLKFSSCVHSLCFYIEITDDQKIERNETFDVFLIHNNPSDDFTIIRQSATIVITDNDGITMH